MGRSGFPRLCAVKNRRVPHLPDGKAAGCEQRQHLLRGVARLHPLSGRLCQRAVDGGAAADVLGGNVPAERLYTGQGFARRGTVRMFYADTGWTDCGLYEYLL